MNRPSNCDISRAGKPQRWLIAAEMVLVFAVFFVQGAWPVPDVNEPYYLGKAIHFWNPDWVPDDFFLDSADTHQVFYFTFGWLALWLSPFWLAWAGRVLTWGLLAWAWRRLSFAFLPRPWLSVLTAALFVCLLERFHMAGEWVVGGVEAKGFAYVLVFLGLEALVRGHWNRVWLLFGAASAFHVLVGGWAVVAAAIAWLLARSDRPTVRSMLPAWAGGLILSLPALVPCIGLTWGVDPEVASRSNRIYVFERLAHHLVFMRFSPEHVDRFLLLLAVLLLLDWLTPWDAARRRLRGFVVGALAIAGMGVAIGLLEAASPALAAGLLRFYWFRLADVALPLATALVGARLLAGALETEPRRGRFAMAAAVLVAFLHVGGYALLRAVPTVPRADSEMADYISWRMACDWVAQSGEVPRHARFLTPRESSTFKWYAGRSEVVTWKDVPQDARSIVAWWERLFDIYAIPSPYGGYRWHGTLADVGTERIRHLGKKYQADYVLTVRWPRLDLPVAYENRHYVIYRCSDPAES